MTNVVYYTHEVDANSSAMKTIYYAKFDQKMFIKWHNDTLSAYDDVSRTAFEEFAASSSKGSYYNSKIYKSPRWQPGDTNVTLVKMAESSGYTMPGEHQDWFYVTVKLQARDISSAASALEGNVVKVEKVD